ncbi:MAG: hypothetical protein AUG75_11525 [Cyanobacteria bacterium 13_1_20CM_4_61_6]|nr:MAG: hypothetical protein AUG75_11525 [Cyanobacteria bacterium 13_1_20CM_4_61_6]
MSESLTSSQREADAKKNLRASHAHGFGRLEHGRVNSGKADIGVAQDGEKRVENESDDSGAFSDAADKRNGNQEAEEGKTGNGLEDTRGAQGDGAQRGALYDEHSEWDANENGDDHGDDHERKVIERGAEDFVAMIHEEGPSGLRIHAEAPGITVRDEVKARTSGCSRRRNSCGAALATIWPASSRTMRDARRRASRRS